MWEVKGNKKHQKKKYMLKVPENAVEAQYKSVFILRCVPLMSTARSELLLSVGETNLAGEEIAVVRDGEGGVHEYLGDGRQVFDALHLQPQQVSVKGLPVDCLFKKIILIINDTPRHFLSHLCSDPSSAHV